MKNQKYSNYTAHIYAADDTQSAAAKGEAMKAVFPGAEYETVDGDPCGQCSNVEGNDVMICTKIQDWINSH